MQIWLDQVQDEPFNWDETQSIAPETLERPELQDLGPVHWRGQVVYADPGYFLRAHLSYEQSLICNRCLKPIVDPREMGASASHVAALFRDDRALGCLRDMAFGPSSSTRRPRSPG